MLFSINTTKALRGCVRLSLHQQHKYISFIPSFSKKKEFRGRKLVGYTQQQMFNVVSDVKNYKHFIPFCKQSDILKKINNEHFQAKLVVGFPPITESYVSEVKCANPTMVKVIGKSGQIFDNLETVWNFKPGILNSKTTSIIEFTIAFQFKSILHSQLANLFFDQLVQQMETAFIKEAERRYGPEKLESNQVNVKIS